MLEKKLGIKGDKKKKNKIMQQIEMEGLGIGFMDFLDEIDTKVKNKIDKN